VLTVVMAAAELAAGSDASDVLVVTHGAILGSLLRRLAPGYLLPAGFPN
jgi:broad specificity phosphatase PhoE